MTLLRRLAPAGLLLAAVGCFEKKPVPCAQDGTCADGLACLDLVCAPAKALNPCQVGTNCGPAGAGASCLRLDGATKEYAICARACTGAGDCGPGELCAPGITLGGAAQNGCLPECLLGVTDCAVVHASPVLACREATGGRVTCTPGRPPNPTWELVEGGMESAEAGAAAGPWKIIKAGFDGTGRACNAGETTCVEGGFTP